MKKVFISQGMRNKTDAKILSERKHLEQIVKNIIDDRVKFIDSIINESAPEATNKSLWYLAKSLELMAGADVVVFAKDWEDYRGCKIEYEAAMAYGIQIIILSCETEGDV